jgi:DNA-binding NarL/FixJ family response regulator
MTAVSGTRKIIQKSRFFRGGLELVRDGGIFVSCSVQERIEAMYEYPEPAGNITGRHMEVTVLACNGKTNRQITETLNVSISTVNNHIAKIYYTLGVHNKSGLIGAAMKLGVVEWDGKWFHAAGSRPGLGKKTTVRRVV